MQLNFKSQHRHRVGKKIHKTQDCFTFFQLYQTEFIQVKCSENPHSSSSSLVIESVGTDLLLEVFPNSDFL